MHWTKEKESVQAASVSQIDLHIYTHIHTYKQCVVSNSPNNTFLDCERKHKHARETQAERIKSTQIGQTPKPFLPTWGQQNQL